MDPTDTNEIREHFENQGGEPPVGEELNHSDKMTGIFTEPSKTFEQTAKFPPRAMDWLLPLISFIIIAIVTNFLLLQNAELKLKFNEMLDEKMQEVETQMQEKVQSGEMTEEQKQTAVEQARKGMQFMTGPVMRSVTLVVWTFIGFFIMAFIYYLLAKFALKGEGNYSSALVARGLPMYILFIQVVVVAIISLVFKKLMIDSSVAAFLEMDRNTVAGYLLSRVDPFAIWFYSVVGIGLAKMFKSESTMKYIIMVFAVWFIGDLILLLLGMGFG